MSKRTSSSIRIRARTAASTLGSERRSLHRLRDLCDEVIASFRVAQGAELLSDAERSEASAFLAQLTPSAAPRPA
jgi:hypothetical protein